MFLSKSRGDLPQVRFGSLRARPASCPAGPTEARSALGAKRAAALHATALPAWAEGRDATGCGFELGQVTWSFLCFLVLIFLLFLEVAISLALVSN